MNEVSKLAVLVDGIRTTYPIADEDARDNITDLQNAIDEIQDILDTHWNVANSPVLYVSKTNSRFTTINSAIDYAKTYCTTSNRVTIVISSGRYEEYIDLDNNPGIDFFGLPGVVVRSSVAWRLSTIRCSNYIRVYNISFENYYTPGEDEHAGYGLHADPITQTQIWYNCSFYSDNNSAIGIGMGDRGQAEFHFCRFRGATGGIYAHNNSTNGTVGQWLRFYNCIVESHDNTNCMRFDDSATMAQAGRTSQMGVVFVNCVGNNNGVTYRYGNPVQTLNYIPASDSYNVFLYEESTGNSLIALDPVKQTKTIILEFPCMGDNEFRITEPDAYKYQWTLSSIRYNHYDDDTSTWSGWTTFEGSKTIEIIKAQPEAFKIVIPGTNTIRGGKRSFEVTLVGIPRKNYTFPETIT